MCVLRTQTIFKAVSPSAFNQIVAYHRPRIFALAWHILSDREEAADVTQTVFIRLWDRRSEIDVDRVDAWLLRVARNAAIDAWRRRRTREGVLSANTEAVEQLPSSHQEPPDAGVASSEFRRRLHGAVGQLPEPQRSIVVLREIEGYQYDEIAEALDLPLNTVKVYLHRARRRLREALRVYSPENA